MHSSLYFLALATLAVAAPAEDLAKRGPKATFGEWTGSTSSFQDGSGTYVKSIDDYKYGTLGTGQHCWTDIYTVNSVNVDREWEQTNTDFDCSSTSVCTSGHVEGSSKCSSWSVTTSFDIGLANSIFSASLGVSSTTSEETCTSVESSFECTWEDSKCHTPWKRTTDIVSVGYFRRRCSSKKGDYTAWSKDLNVTKPSPDLSVGCAATCDMKTYPEGQVQQDPVPSNGTYMLRRHWK